jgi:hypothetical protein
MLELKQELMGFELQRKKFALQEREILALIDGVRQEQRLNEE